MRMRRLLSLFSSLYTVTSFHIGINKLQKNNKIITKELIVAATVVFFSSLCFYQRLKVSGSVIQRFTVEIIAMST